MSKDLAAAFGFLPPEAYRKRRVSVANKTAAERRAALEATRKQLYRARRSLKSARESRDKAKEQLTAIRKENAKLLNELRKKETTHGKELAAMHEMYQAVTLAAGDLRIDFHDGRAVVDADELKNLLNLCGICC